MQNVCQTRKAAEGGGVGGPFFPERARSRGNGETGGRIYLSADEVGVPSRLWRPEPAEVSR